MRKQKPHSVDAVISAPTTLEGPFIRVKRNAKLRKGFERVLLMGQTDPRMNGIFDVPTKVVKNA